DRLVLANSIVHEPVSPRAEALMLSQAIVEVVEETYRVEPERAAAFAARLDSYERRLARLRISDEWLAKVKGKNKLIGPRVGRRPWLATRHLWLGPPPAPLCDRALGRASFPQARHAESSNLDDRNHCRHRRLWWFLCRLCFDCPPALRLAGEPLVCVIAA